MKHFLKRIFVPLFWFIFFNLLFVALSTIFFDTTYGLAAFPAKDGSVRPPWKIELANALKISFIAYGLFVSLKVSMSEYFRHSE